MLPIFRVFREEWGWGGGVMTKGNNEIPEIPRAQKTKIRQCWFKLTNQGLNDMQNRKIRKIII
jgi:hypothetical protein